MEAPARAIAPVIGEVLDFIAGQGALLARMSGSGATCFGLFESDTAAARAADAIRAAHPEWWAVATTLGPVSDVPSPADPA
jgi:4-diphosphocytidyl-2-C-methyl-D-erythritol kinase